MTPLYFAEKIFSYLTALFLLNANTYYIYTHYEKIPFLFVDGGIIF